jgi:hypothetical protein
MTNDQAPMTNELVLSSLSLVLASLVIGAWSLVIIQGESVTILSIPICRNPQMWPGGFGKSLNLG